MLIRVVGPTLATAPFNVTGVLVDPKLTLYRHDAGSNSLIAKEDDWGEDADAYT